MASNMLSVPFRRTHTVSMAEALKQYISKEYDQHPDMFKSDLATIDQLRNDAVTLLEPHTSGIKKLAAYAAQLVWVGGKFPIDIGVEFVWFTALGFNTQRGVAENNLRFELANVLFNLTALYSQLAVSLNRSTDAGLKGASKYFCQAAGVLEYLKTDIIPDMRTAPPEDMDPSTLDSLQQLLLAQAQECSWSVAVRNGYKDASIAKLAAKVSDFYDLAADHGTRSDTISTEWIHHMSAKHHHFAAAAQYRAACDCLEKRKYGEEVARLKDSVNCVNEALKEKRWLNHIVLGDLNGLKMKVTEDLKRAEKDNDVIYLQTVPPKSELKALDRAVMATAKDPTDISDPSSSLGDKGVYGQPLFVRLVPYSVHVAASLYVDRRDRIVNTQIIDELEALTDKVRDVLQSLNLPGSLQALEKPLGIPPSVNSHAEEIRQQGGVHRLQRSIREVETLRKDDVATFEEGVSFLQAESTEDERARAKHGTDRWTRVPSNVAAQALYNKVDEIKGYLDSAEKSDGLIKNKLKESENVVRVLEGTDRDLENYIPSSRKPSMPPKLEQDASRLRAILNEISRLESRRRRKAEALREKAKADDINPVLLGEAARLEREFPLQKIEAVQFEDLFEKRLHRFDEDRNMVNEEREDQEQLLAQLREANTAFKETRKGQDSNRGREQALQKLESAYLKYKEILGNLDSARKFYNDLARIVNGFREESKSFRYSRRVEAGQLETDLSNAMSTLNLSAQSSLQDQKERASLRSAYNAARPPGADPMPAPVPTRAAPVAAAAAGLQHQQQQQQQPPLPNPNAVWSPEMGIKFAPVATAGNAQNPMQPGGTNVHNPQYPSAKPVPGRWSPSKGMKFG